MYFFQNNFANFVTKKTPKNEEEVQYITSQAYTAR